MLTTSRETILQATTDLVLELAISPIQQLLHNVDTYRQILVDETEEYIDLANTAMIGAANEAIHYVTLVLGNNPRKKKSDVLKRADVIEAMNFPFNEEAFPQIDFAVASAWEKAWGIGVQHGASDLAVWGVDAAHPDVDMKDPFLAALRKDVKRNTKDAAKKIRYAVLHSTSETLEADLTKALDDLRLRLRLSVEAARTRAATQAQIATYGMAGESTGQDVKLLWVCSFGPNTCATCAALHGTVVNYGEHFDSALSLRGRGAMPYVNLAGPPRHPNCMCRLAVLMDGGVGKVGPTPTSMKEWAQQWWSKKAGQQ